MKELNELELKEVEGGLFLEILGACVAYFIWDSIMNPKDVCKQFTAGANSYNS